MIHDDPLVLVSESVKNRSSTETVAVVFDLDSTLFEVSGRTKAILRSLASREDFKSRFETASEALRTLDVLPTDWGIKSLFARHRALASVELVQQVRDFWRKHFFSSHFLDHDEMHPYANEYVGHLAHLGAEIFYLTGRPEGAMREGTVQSLARWNFPLASPAHLLMKPLEAETDAHFKIVALRALAPRFGQIWMFENEPLIIDQVRSALPQVRLVFVDTVHSGKSSPPSDLPKIGWTFDGPWRR